MSNLNHFVCPTCGHDFYATGAYAKCDGCYTVFYVSQSTTCQPKSINDAISGRDAKGKAR